MAHIFISAAHKSSGKTTLSIGLCAAFKNQGLSVQPFKKGPDYIDPMWLSRAAGRPCYNLDFHTQTHDEIVNSFAQHGHDADISIIEGNKGLYDGLDLDGGNSNAALATVLDSPVILVIDAQGMTRGIAPLILGYQAFEPNINIAGVILNQLGGSRHESKLRAVIEHYTDVPVVGAVHRNPDLNIQERHLGLVPSNEMASVEQQIQLVANIIKDQVDLPKLQQIAETAATPGYQPTSVEQKPQDIRIGITQDAAFGFYYADDIEAFKRAGAELVPVNTLTDTQLPNIDGLFIGGGFPETQMQNLESNASLRTSIRNAIESDLPVYAECGGLMYLTRSLSWQDKQCKMVGAIPADTLMHTRPQGRGYVKLIETDNALWPHKTGDKIVHAHEFHYSSLTNIDPDLQYAYKVQRGHGINGVHDGIIYRNVFACYTHLRDVDNNRWVNRFVQFVRNFKTNL
jgi:cobyrinic acid a,c-diamide synthase